MRRATQKSGNWEIFLCSGTGVRPPEYLEKMYLMLQQSEPDDCVIAAGESQALKEFVVQAFATLGLDWEKHTFIDTILYRPTEIALGKGNPAKAKEKLGWQAKYKKHDVVKMMVEAKQAKF